MEQTECLRQVTRMRDTIHRQHEHLIECLFQWLAIPRCEDIGVAHCTSLAWEEDSSGSADRVVTPSTLEEPEGRSPGIQESA